MSAMIQIRNVPEHIHRTLKARSALLGKSLSDLILEELQAMVSVPSAQELQLELKNAAPFAMRASAAELIRQERDSQ